MRDRLERMRADAAINEREKEEKRKQKAEADRIQAMSPGRTTAKKAAAKSMPGATRMKMVWAICDRRAETVKSFPFPKKAEAEAELARMNAELPLKDQHVLQKRRVPMDA